eukprot:CAMPEP_0202688446 /NCGR_PEP_ID=MMETSP1385-20130828/3966_1 /ASSEMBLY_ACC=CAM_ASM_000861 /TAXON_ID=933848 /ORGANISM="Elphidium margaritaceum" /LENGTH=205 /DNA_ID=CAMNT_0049343433 /DNA_START=305 /DNA_END=922 /DNA_ORIENTATION=+
MNMNATTDINTTFIMQHIHNLLLEEQLLIFESSAYLLNVAVEFEDQEDSDIIIHIYITVSTDSSDDKHSLMLYANRDVFSQHIQDVVSQSHANEDIVVDAVLIDITSSDREQDVTNWWNLKHYTLGQWLVVGGVLLVAVLTVTVCGIYACYLCSLKNRPRAKKVRNDSIRYTNSFHEVEGHMVRGSRRSVVQYAATDDVLIPYVN